MSLVATLPEPNVGRANSLPFSLIAEGVMRSRRNCAESTCLFSAARSPEIFSPAEFVPVNVNTAIFNLRPTDYQMLHHPSLNDRVDYFRVCAAAAPVPRSPTPRFTISCNSSAFDERMIAVSSVICFWKYNVASDWLNVCIPYLSWPDCIDE